MQQIYKAKITQSLQFCQSTISLRSIFSCVMHLRCAFLLQQSFTRRAEEGAIITSSSHLGFWRLVICGPAAALYRGVVQLHFNPLVFLA